MKEKQILIMNLILQLKNNRIVRMKKQRVRLMFKKINLISMLQGVVKKLRFRVKGQNDLSKFL